MELFNFDKKGNLFPYEIIELTFNDFVEYFVYSFSIESSRYTILEKYIEYLQNFRKNITNEFEHWIDGSFVTQKENPGDIDFVNIIPHKVYLQKEEEILNQFTMFGVWKKYGDYLDVFAAPNFPKQHKNWEVSQANLAYWKDKYGTTRINDEGIRFPKGIISIKFDYFTLK